MFVGYLTTPYQIRGIVSKGVMTVVVVVVLLVVMKATIFLKYKLTLFTNWRNYPCIICSNYKCVTHYFSVRKFTLEQVIKAQKDSEGIALRLL
jgi:hypothetical protein